MFIAVHGIVGLREGHARRPLVTDRHRVSHGGMVGLRDGDGNKRASCGEAGREEQGRDP
jgi:hypothetical protein